MKRTNKKTVLILIALIALLCLALSACRKYVPEEAPSTDDHSVSEQVSDTGKDADETASKQDEKAADADKTAEKKQTEQEEAAREQDEQASPETQTGSNTTVEKKKPKEKTESKDNKKKSSKKKDSKKKTSEKGESKKESEKKEPKKVWVEPVTETRTVTLDTGTRYCNGVNSNGGCGASWHGTKDSTYNSWHSHWQDYVKKRTKEEADKGKVYVCDHIHDDSRWVPDTATEEVVVQEGYWKEVD